MAEIRKTQMLLLSLLMIAVISGCVDSTVPTTTTEIDPVPAYNAIKQAQSFYQAVESDLSKASAPVNEAKSRGVETTSSSVLVSSLQSKLSNAANVLNEALSNYNSQNYPLAKSYAEESLAFIQEVQSQLGQIKLAVENDYKATAAKYKPQLIEAERQYRIGQKYIESVQKVGVDISGQQARLQEVMTTLNHAKESYRSNSFIGLSGKINSVTSASQQVQGELTDIYHNALIVDASNRVESQVAVQEAKNYLSEANSLRQQKRYQEAVFSLNMALVTENLADVLGNVNKLKQIAHNTGLEASFPALDDKLSSLLSYAASGNFDAVKQEIEVIKTEVITTTEDIAKVADANRVIDDTSKLSFWWAEKPDTSASNVKLTEAKKFLSQGDHVSAADTSYAAIEMAANERNMFWSEVKSNWVLNAFLGIAKVISDPEKYEPKPVERPQFEWKAMPELIRIEFDRPIADVSDIVIEDPGTPTLPTIQQNAQTTSTKKPVSFELDPGTQIECGTTCRETTATLKNTGDETAHNVCVALEVYNSNGEIIYINGGSPLQRCIGDLSGGQSKSERVKIEADCGFLFGKCLAKPLTLKSKATSNERTVEFKDQQFS